MSFIKNGASQSLGVVKVDADPSDNAVQSETDVKDTKPVIKPQVN